MTELENKLSQAEDRSETWFKNCLTQVPGISHPDELSNRDCFNTRTSTKETLSRLLFEGVKLAYQQQKLIKQLRERSQVLMAETINCQSSVIKLQEELISAQKTQVAEIKSSVQSSVESAVVKSYSDAVNAVKSVTAVPSEGAALNQETLKKVVKQVVAEEDRSRNLMVFGLDEEEDEQLGEKITAIFEELGEKPRHEAVRLGLRKNSKVPQPTKVTLSNF